MSYHRGRVLLLTFDAFGTLFTPRMPIAKQYAMVAQRHGLFVNEDDLHHSFRQGESCYFESQKVMSIYIHISGIRILTD